MKKKRVKPKPANSSPIQVADGNEIIVGTTSCQPQLKLVDRPLLAFGDAAKLMALFKVLANDTRIRLLHHLIREGEATVSDIAKNLEMKVQAVSNQLARLTYSGILSSRRDGNNMLYRVANSCVSPMLDLALCLMEDQCCQTPGKQSFKQTSSSPGKKESSNP